MDKISITIVAYHNYDEVKEAIYTIEKYTNKNITKHIYIVDNSLTVNKEFEKIISFFKDVEYLNTGANLGFGKGHNYVLDKINSKYHAIVNPDIILKEDSLSKLISFMESNESFGMCVPKLIDEKGNMQFVYRKNPTIFDMFIRMFCKKLFPKRIKYHTLQNKDYTKPFQVPFAQGSFLIIKSQLFKELKGFDENFFMYMEDADLCRRVNQITKLMYCPETEVIHKWNKGSHKNIMLFMSHIKSMKYYFTKWGYSLF